MYKLIDITFSFSWV